MNPDPEDPWTRIPDRDEPRNRGLAPIVLILVGMIVVGGSSTGH